MSIETKGFLSKKIKRFTKRLREEHDEVFALARAMSETAQQFMKIVSIGSPDPDEMKKSLAALILTRATSTFQGVIILSERGMMPEAGTLTRACFENAAALTAVAHGQGDVVAKFVAATQYEDRKLVAELMKPATAQHLDEEQRAKLVTREAELTAENPVGYSIFDMAKDGGIIDLYILYRRLSSDAAHPGLNSLDRYFDPSVHNGKRTLTWGPLLADDELPDTLLMAVAFFLPSLDAANSVLGNDTFDPVIRAHLAEYKRLIQAEGETDG